MLAPATALGGSVAIDAPKLVFAGGGGENNDLSIELIASDFRVTDDQAVLTAGTGCTQENSHSALCNAAGVTRLDVATASGTDFVQVVNTTVPATLDGGSGTDDLTGGAGGDTLIAGTGTIANDILFGGDGPDELVGSTNANAAGTTMLGEAGADTLSAGPSGSFMSGGPGADDINGGDSTNDTADYSGSVNPVTVTVGSGANDGEAGEGDNVDANVDGVFGGNGNDTLIGTDGRQSLFGSGGEDSLFGGPGPDELFGSSDDDGLRGEGGDDFLQGSSGADRMFGGDGIDDADYGDRFDPLIPITVSLNDIANDGAPGEGDNVRSDVEDVRTGAGNDTLIGNGLDNELVGQGGIDQLTGNAGEDRLFGDFTFNSGSGGGDTLNGGDDSDLLRGDFGADTMVGGPATDEVNYASRNNPLTVTVGGGANDGEAGEGDNVAADVEMVVGGTGGDDIEGGAGASILYGGGGVDNLKGAGGDDLLEGENPGAFSPIAGDTLNGGPGVDTVSYHVSHFNVTADIDGVADDGIVGENDNVLTNVENLFGTDGSDTLTGSAVENTIVGRDGNDTLFGGDGPDHLSGRGGSDTHNGQEGNDRINSRRDGVVDFDNCGEGTDFVFADSFDNVNEADCENVDAP
jgi:Ca2+-binding RTX toxin-like protein